MPVVSGTLKIKDDGVTKVIIVKGDPIKAYSNPPPRFWEECVGNAGQPIELTYTIDPGPPPTETITGVEIG